MTKNHRHELTLSADQNLVLAFHQRHHPLLNMLRSAPLIGSTLTQSELDALPDLLCDYLDERDETWVSFAKRSGCPQDALVGLLLRAEPLQPNDLELVVLRLAQDEDVEGGNDSGPDQLRDWLFANRMSQSTFAKLADVAYKTVLNVLSGQSDASPESAVKFEVATSGEVPASAFLEAGINSVVDTYAEMSLDEASRRLGIPKATVVKLERDALKKISGSIAGYSERGFLARRMMQHLDAPKKRNIHNDHATVNPKWNWDVVTEMTSRRSCRVLMRDGKPVDEVETKPTMALDHKSKTWKAMNAANRKASAVEVEK